MSNEKGSLFAEAIVSLFIFMFFILMYLPVHMYVLKSVTVNTLDWSEQHEWYIATLQIEEEIRTTHSIIVSPTMIVLLNKSNSAHVSYSMLSRSLKRIIYSGGEEIVVRNVKNVKFIDNGSYFTIEITKENGVIFERKFVKNSHSEK